MPLKKWLCRFLFFFFYKTYTYIFFMTLLIVFDFEIMISMYFKMGNTIHHIAISKLIFGLTRIRSCIDSPQQHLNALRRPPSECMTRCLLCNVSFL